MELQEKIDDLDEKIMTTMEEWEEVELELGELKEKNM